MTSLTVLLLLLHGGLAIFACCHALIHRPTGRSATLWFGPIVLLPLLGLMLYAVLGIDRISRRALFKGRSRAELRKSYPEVPGLTALLREHACQPGEPLADIHAVVGRLSQRPVLRDNDLSLLVDGEQFFPALMNDIAAATSTINLMTYIFDEDSVGQDVLDALVAAAERGVGVRVLYDAAGCVGTPWVFFEVARSRGVALIPFFPLNPLARRAQINLRNHRKVIVIDGKLGYIGGMNISRTQMAGDIDNEDRCRDLHLRVRGPVVQQLQEVFVEDWYYATGEKLLNEEHFPRLEPAGSDVARVITGGPDEEYEHILQLYFAAIGGAKRSIRLVTPYFIPEAPLSYALMNAALRGVETELFLPGKSDHPFIKRASYMHLPGLIEAGVKIYEQAPPFIHTKAYLFDDAWALMGSPNMDPRSFRLSYESILEISHTSVLDELKSWIDDSRANSTLLTASTLQSRPLRSRLLDRFCNLFSPIL
jgi:cardiolipin synthase